MTLPGMPDYLHLPPGASLPTLETIPSKFIVILEDVVTEEWRDLTSDWIIQCGCLYMMAWGQDCTKWDDSVDHANLSLHDYENIPEKNSVMTTWHEKQPLEEVFWFSHFCAHHSEIELERTVILDICKQIRKSEMLERYANATTEN